MPLRRAGTPVLTPTLPGPRPCSAPLREELRAALRPGNESYSSRALLNANELTRRVFSSRISVRVIGELGLQFDSAIEVVSCVLTAAGLYLSFTGDAKGWFNA